jgi:hypothetical protein
MAWIGKPRQRQGPHCHLILPQSAPAFSGENGFFELLLDRVAGMV